MCFVDLKEAQKEMVAEWNEYAKAAKLVFFENGNVCLKDVDENHVHVYEVPLNECKTVFGFCEWYYHLKEKNWVTEAMLYHFAKTVCRELTEHEGSF